MLYFAALAITGFGVIFTAVYLWQQIFVWAEDSAARSKGLLGAIRYAVFLSLLFAFLSFLLGKNDSPAEAVARLCRLYSVVAACWLGGALLSGVAAVSLFLSKYEYRDERVKAVRRAFRTSVFGAVIAGFLTWLLG